LFDSPKDDAKLKATDFGLSVFYKPGLIFLFWLIDSLILQLVFWFDDDFFVA
jgi:hypothetical protein